MPVRNRLTAVRPGASVAAILVAAATLTAVQSGLRLPLESNADRFGGRAIVAGEVLVAFRETPDFARLRVDLDTEADTLVGSGHVWRARSRSRSVAALLAHLAGRPDVLYAEPNYIVTAVREPNDPRFPELWGPHTISAIPAWDLALGSRTVVVGVVDTGIDYAHPDLAANVWTSLAPLTVTIGGQTITCPPGTHGFNAITRTCDPLDDHFHGTHVSGTIGAVGNNGVGVTGVNWNASIMGLKFLSAAGSGSIGDAINAIEFAVQARMAGANIRVLSNSWAGGGYSQALNDEIARAGQNDILFVAAAGNNASDNDATPTYPASYAQPNLLAVAATDSQDALASFSNYGATTVHLGAPGVGILSTTTHGQYESFSGTSMATPHVSGTAALLLSRCTLSTSALKSAILNAVDPVASLAGKTITGGRLNAGRAVANCGRSGNVSPSITLDDPIGEGTMAAPGPITLSASAFDSDGTIARVTFFAGTALIGVVNAPPFQRVWTDVPVGNYAITAVATDNDGATTTSAAATVHVLPGPTSQPFQGSAIAIPGVVEAENFNEGGEGSGYHDLTAGNSGGAYRTTDVDIVTTSDGGDGFAVTSVNAGEWLAYGVNALESGVYTLQARVAGGDGVFHVEIDGMDVTGPMTVPNTGNLAAWQTFGMQGIPIQAGYHLMRVVFDTKGANGFVATVNYFRWSVGTGNTPPSVTITAPASGASYGWPTTIALTATAADADGSVAQVRFYDGATLVATDTASPYTASLANPVPGTHALTAVAVDNNGASTTSGVVSVEVVAPPPSAPFGGTAATIPALIEVENFDDGGEGIAYHDTTAGNSGGKYRQTDVDIEQTTDTGGGYSIGWIRAGEWLMYSVTAASDGDYAVEMRVASPGTGGKFHIEVDRVAATGPLTVPLTGGWQTWQSMVVSGIPLTAGPHLIRIVFDTNSSAGYVGNFNAMRWTIPANNLPPSVTLTAPTGGASFNAPATITLSATASDTDGTVTQVSFYAGTTLIGTDTTAPYPVTWTNVAVGTYSLTAVATDTTGATGTSTPAVVQVVTPPPSTPFGGAPWLIPGTIEMENFDEGGEGIAYHDTTTVNSGGKYRSTGVDIETTTDVGGGYSIGWVSASEWLKYTVNVSTTGTYGLEVRVASIATGGTFHVEVDGAAVTAPISVPRTGGWQIWGSVTVPGIPLTAGPHVVRVVFDTNGSSGYIGNMNWMRWTLTP